MRKCVSIFRNPTEASPWGDGNLADSVVVKNIFLISKIVVPLHFEKMDL